MSYRSHLEFCGIHSEWSRSWIYFRGSKTISRFVYLSGSQRLACICKKIVLWKSVHCSHFNACAAIPYEVFALSLLLTLFLLGELRDHLVLSILTIIYGSLARMVRNFDTHNAPCFGDSAFRGFHLRYFADPNVFTLSPQTCHQ